MKVLKFGGTSVGTPESLAHVKQIVESLHEPAVIVVSALGGLTDRLISTATAAAGGKISYKEAMIGISRRHRDVIEAVIEPSRRDEVLGIVEPLLAELANLYDGVALIGDLPERTLCQIVSFGERISSVIVSRMISGAVHRDSMQFVKTEKWFNKNIADSQLTDRLIKEQLGNLEQYPVITGGFIATDRDTGEITNLGRGGSDYTAALIAASLNASELEIWTDVDGFMTADPRIIPQAKVIPSLSFIESMELCSFGAKVVYPPTIYPVFHKNIPIRILNTFRPEAEGTLITDKAGTHTAEAKGVTSLGKIDLISIEGHSAENVPEINSRSFNALAKSGVSILLVSQPTETTGFAFAVASADGGTALSALQAEFAPERENGEVSAIIRKGDMTVLAAVGENIGRQSAMGPRLRGTLERNGIAVEASSHGSSASSHAFIVGSDNAVAALRLLHEALFE